MNVRAVVFDIGGVLIDWNPNYLYQKVFAGDEEKMNHFLANICTREWNDAQDLRNSFDTGVSELKTQYPDWAEYIEIYGTRWEEMLGHRRDETAEVLYELDQAGYSLYALSNLVGDKKAALQNRYAFMKRFEGMVISGEEGVKKPDRKIFKILLEKYDLIPEQTLFIDDLEKNTAVAQDFGMQAIQFKSAKQLKQDLQEAGLLARVP